MFITIFMSINYGLDYNKATIYCDIFNFVVLQRFLLKQLQQI